MATTSRNTSEEVAQGEWGVGVCYGFAARTLKSESSKRNPCYPELLIDFTGLQKKQTNKKKQKRKKKKKKKKKNLPMRSRLCLPNGKQMNANSGRRNLKAVI